MRNLMCMFLSMFSAMPVLAQVMNTDLMDLPPLNCTPASEENYDPCLWGQWVFASGGIEKNAREIMEFVVNAGQGARYSISIPGGLDVGSTVTFNPAAFFSGGYFDGNAAGQMVIQGQAGNGSAAYVDGSFAGCWSVSEGSDGSGSLYMDIQKPAGIAVAGSYAPLYTEIFERSVGAFSGAGSKELAYSCTDSTLKLSMQFSRLLAPEVAPFMRFDDIIWNYARAGEE